MNSISSELTIYDLPKNRTGNLTVNSELELPVTLDQCLINSDENYQAIASTINNSLSGLYLNYLYLYSKCFVINNNFPTNSPVYIGNQQNSNLTFLTITDINTQNLNTIAPKNTINFTVNRFIENYSITINLSAITTPQQLAYAYVDALTSLPNNLFASETPLSGATGYTVSLTGKPSTSLNNNFNTNPNNIFYTTSTFTSNSGITNLTESSDPDNFTRFSFYSKLSAGMDNLVDIQVGYNPYTETKVIFCASATRIYVFNENATGISLVYSSNTLGYQRDINFQQITSILLVGEKLYIGEGVYNSIYYVDVSGFVGNNPINSNRFTVEGCVGGTGTANDITQFSYPELQFEHNGEIYVFDKNNLTLKVYDLNLNYLESVNLKSLAKLYPFVSSIKPFGKYIYNGVFNVTLLCSYSVIGNQSTYRVNNVVVLDPASFIPKFLVNLSFNTTNEILTTFTQSSTTDFIAYISSNKNLYKFNLTNFSQIGVFNPATPNISTLNIIEIDNQDYVYTYSSTGFGLITKFVDTINYNFLLTNSDFNIYTYNELTINSNEFQTFLVYNKTFKKLFYNFSKLLSNIALRPTYDLNIGTSLNSKVFRQLEYLNNETLSKLLITETKDYYIGENEIFTNDTINRVITQFYGLIQLALQAISNNVVVNFSTIALPSTSTSINLPRGFVMTEQFSITDPGTYNSVILTQNGKGIVVEGYQALSIVPSTVTTTSYKVIDSNVSIVIPLSSTLTTNNTPIIAPPNVTPVTPNIFTEQKPTTPITPTTPTTVIITDPTKTTPIEENVPVLTPVYNIKMSRETDSYIANYNQFQDKIKVQVSNNNTATGLNPLSNMVTWDYCRVQNDAANGTRTFVVGNPGFLMYPQSGLYYNGTTMPTDWPISGGQPTNQNSANNIIATFSYNNAVLNPPISITKRFINASTKLKKINNNIIMWFVPLKNYYYNFVFRLYNSTWPLYKFTNANGNAITTPATYLVDEIIVKKQSNGNFTFNIYRNNTNLRFVDVGENYDFQPLDCTIFNNTVYLLVKGLKTMGVPSPTANDQYFAKLNFETQTITGLYVLKIPLSSTVFTPTTPPIPTEAGNINYVKQIDTSTWGQPIYIDNLTTDDWVKKGQFTPFNSVVDSTNLLAWEIDVFNIDVDNVGIPTVVIKNKVIEKYWSSTDGVKWSSFNPANVSAILQTPMV